MELELELVRIELVVELALLELILLYEVHHQNLEVLCFALRKTPRLLNRVECFGLLDSDKNP